MTHTQTVQTILDATRSNGVIFHTLSEGQRSRIKVAGRDYMLGHATGRRDLMEDGLRRVIETIREGR